MDKSQIPEMDKNKKDNRFASSTLIVVGSEELPKAKIIEYYDPDLDKWSKLTDIDARRIHFKSAILGDKLMLTGGRLNANPSTTVQSFDFSTGVLTTVARMSTARTFHAISVYADELIVIGGDNNDGYVDEVESYNPITNTWKALKPMPTARGHCESTMHDIDNEIYVMGGFAGDYLSAVEAYNPLLDSWKKCAPMKQTRYGFAIASIGNFIYTVGGFNNVIGIIDEIDRYEPLTDTWTPVEVMDFPRFFCGSINFNDAMIVAGGADINGVTDLVESYENEEWKNLGPLTASRIFFNLLEVPWQLIEKTLKRQN